VFNTLTGLCGLFEDAVRLAGGHLTPYRRFTILGLEIDDLERTASQVGGGIVQQRQLGDGRVPLGGTRSASDRAGEKV